MAKKYNPLYKRIEQYITDQIQKGNWQPGTRIPSENELSEQFGVSRITIKNALSELVNLGIVYRQQGKGTFVGELTQADVLSQIPKSALAQAPEKTIGFLIPRLDNRFTAQLLSGVEDAVCEKGYRLLFAKTNDSQQTEIQKIREMRELGVEGLIIYPVEGEHYNSEILSLTLNKFPLVLLDRVLKGVETHTVCSDHYNGAIEAVNYLHQLGHRHIGFLSTRTEGTTSMEERLAGYEQALEDHHILIDRNLEMTKLHIHHRTEDNNQLIEQFLQENRHMTALLSSNFSTQVVQIAQRLDIGIPDELSIIFFDDLVEADFAVIPPTAIVQQEVELGRKAGRLLIESIENRALDYRQMKLATSIVVRQSTSLPK